MLNNGWNQERGPHGTGTKPDLLCVNKLASGEREFFLCVLSETGLQEGNGSLSSSLLPPGPLHLSQEHIILAGHLN